MRISIALLLAVFVSLPAQAELFRRRRADFGNSSSGCQGGSCMSGSCSGGSCSAPATGSCAGGSCSAPASGSCAGGSCSAPSVGGCTGPNCSAAASAPTGCTGPNCGAGQATTCSSGGCGSGVSYGKMDGESLTDILGSSEDAPMDAIEKSLEGHAKNALEEESKEGEEAGEAEALDLAGGFDVRTGAEYDKDGNLIDGKRGTFRPVKKIAADGTITVLGDDGGAMALDPTKDAKAISQVQKMLAKTKGAQKWSDAVAQRVGIPVAPRGAAAVAQATAPASDAAVAGGPIPIASRTPAETKAPVNNVAGTVGTAVAAAAKTIGQLAYKMPEIAKGLAAAGAEAEKAQQIEADAKQASENAAKLEKEGKKAEAAKEKNRAEALSAYVPTLQAKAGAELSGVSSAIQGAYHATQTAGPAEEPKAQPEAKAPTEQKAPEQKPAVEAKAPAQPTTFERLTKAAVDFGAQAQVKLAAVGTAMAEQKAAADAKAKAEAEQKVIADEKAQAEKKALADQKAAEQKALAEQNAQADLKAKAAAKEKVISDAIKSMEAMGLKDIGKLGFNVCVGDQCLKMDLTREEIGRDPAGAKAKVQAKIKEANADQAKLQAKAKAAVPAKAAAAKRLVASAEPLGPAAPVYATPAAKPAAAAEVFEFNDNSPGGSMENFERQWEKFNESGTKFRAYFTDPGDWRQGHCSACTPEKIEAQKQKAREDGVPLIVVDMSLSNPDHMKRIGELTRYQEGTSRQGSIPFLYQHDPRKVGR